jgi:hypothetical protein
MLAENADQLYDMFLEYCNVEQREDFVEPSPDESELGESTDYIMDDSEDVYKELFENHPKASKAKEIDCLELKMRREYAEAILRGTKPVEFRQFKDFYINKLIDMETQSIRQVKKIHFHNYNRTWFLDIECSETNVFSITKEDIKFLQEKYGVHDFDEHLEYYEKNHIEQRPRFFYFVVSKILDTNLNV